MTAPPANFGCLFDGPLARDPGHAALIQDDMVLSYAALDERCNRLGNMLAGFGVGPGDRVALLFDNHWRFVECLFGAMRIGAVPVPVNIRMNDARLVEVVADCGAVVAIVAPGLCGRMRRLVPDLPAVQLWFGDQDRTDTVFHPLEALMDDASPARPGWRAASADICMQPYTSGSTGRPKGVLLTHGGQLWNGFAVADALATRAGDRALVAVPLFHKNAMTAVVKPFLIGGGTVVILPGFDPGAVIRAIERYRITYMTGVPAMYKRVLAETALLDAHDLTSLDFLVCGSAEVSEELLGRLQKRFGVEVMEGYGLTEGGPVPIIDRRGEPHRRGSCGRATPGGEVRLIRADGSDAGTNEPGELLVRSPGVAAGYWRRPDEAQGRFVDGWLRTGDLMRRDADGFYYFVGRADDMMNVSGENVYPKEVESALLAHPDVRDVCVVPGRHPEKGVAPVAYVVSGDDALDEDGLRRFYLDRGPPYAYPRRIVFRDALPLGPTGKVDRASLIAEADRLVAAWHADRVGGA